MPKEKYFVVPCNMNRRDLRSGIPYHFCLLFLKADCNAQGVLSLPLKMIDAYGYYSHNSPNDVLSCRAEPWTFFGSKIGLRYRLDGSYGEWKHEDLHDLNLGMGLTGRLLEIEPAQWQEMISKIQRLIELQNEFIAHVEKLEDREKVYQDIIRALAFYFMLTNDEPLSNEVALQMAKESSPLREFQFDMANPRTCKVAALELLQEAYRDNDDMLAVVNALMSGVRAISAIPRLTPGLKPIKLHLDSREWEKKGNGSQYPYLPWEKMTPGDMYVVDCDGKYTDLEGNEQQLFESQPEVRKLVRHLKIINRICEINLGERQFQLTHSLIGIHLRNIAESMYSNIMLHKHAGEAEAFLKGLFEDRRLTRLFDGFVPKNLTPYYKEVKEAHGLDKKPLLRLSF